MITNSAVVLLVIGFKEPEQRIIIKGREIVLCSKPERRFSTHTEMPLSRHMAQQQRPAAKSNQQT